MYRSPIFARRDDFVGQVAKTCGGLLIRLPLAMKHLHRLQFAAMRGAVENLAQKRDILAGGCINIPAGEVCPGEVFITFGGAQRHVDRLPNLRGGCQPPLSLD